MSSGSGSNTNKGITMSDMLNPLYLHPSDGPHTGVISEKLTGPANYRAWRSDMEIVLASKRKLGFVTGLVKKDAENAEKKDQWETCNSMVIAWLTGSMTPQVKETVRYVRSAKEVWDQLARRYNVANGTRKFKLNKSLYEMKQKGMSVTEYYSKMKCLWDEIESMRNYPPITQMNTEICAFTDAMSAEREQDKLFQFLNGIDEDYQAERSHLLMFSPLPSVEDAYSRLVQEEAQREISQESKEVGETGAMFVKKEKEELWCSVCEMKGHIKEKCWKVIGYPKWHPKAKRRERFERGGTSGEGGRGFRGQKNQSGNSKWAGNAHTDEAMNFTADQLKEMLKIGSGHGKNGSETEEELEANFAVHAEALIPSIVTMKNLNEFQGFWGSVARKAKAVLDDEAPPEQIETTKTARQREDIFGIGQQDGRYYQTTQSHKKPDKAVLRKGFGAIASSFNYIGNALEEGLNKVENRTADIIQDTRNRRSHVRKQAAPAPDSNQQPSYPGHVKEPSGTQKQTSSVTQTDTDIQLQASRDVAMAMAAKTKVLLRELKTVKSDLAFAKERCAQLEEENRILRESMENGDNPEDDELIRLQLESLLAEKARLAQENAFYARENRFLREVVEYHQLTMQDVVYLNERNEEIMEVYPGAKVPGGTNLNSVAGMPSPSPPVHASELVSYENMNSK